MDENEQIQDLCEKLAKLIAEETSTPVVALSALAAVLSAIALASHEGNIEKTLENFEKVGVPGIKENIKLGVTAGFSLQCWQTEGGK